MAVSLRSSSPTPEQGPVLGFEIWDLSQFELPDEDPEVWAGPRFIVLRLGLVDASAGEIVLAVRAQFDGAPTADALHFHTAIAAPSAEDALPHWELALDAGDMRPHFGLDTRSSRSVGPIAAMPTCVAIPN